MKNAFWIAIAFCLVFTGSLYAGKAPSVAKLDTLVDKYEPVTFDHEKHTSIAGNCGTCHHQHENFGTLPCKECHSVTPAMFKSSVSNNFMACKNCHAAYDPANPKVPGLKTAYHQQCFQCHRGMAEVGISPAGCTMMCHGKKGPKS